MATLQDMVQRRDEIKISLRTLAETQSPSDDDVILQDTLIAEYDALDPQITKLQARMANLARIETAADDDSNREDAVPAKKFNAPNVNVRSKDPLDGVDIDAVREGRVYGNDMRVRAMDMIEREHKTQRWQFDDDAAEVATKRVQNSIDNYGVARHILLTGDESYREAFRTYMQTKDPYPLQSDPRFRAINLTNASGGFLLPFVLDPTIVLTNGSSANPFRRVSRIVQTTSNAWQGVSSAGVNAAFINEATTAADGAPGDLAQIQIKPQKGAAWVIGSYEALDDTDFGTQLPGLLSDARDRLESSKFATGSGTNEPLGVIAALGTGSRVAPSTTGTAFNGTASNVDIYAIQAALPARFRQSGRAAFMANISPLNKVRAIDQQGGSSFWANFTSNTPAELLGQPIYEASDLPSATTGTSAASGTGSATLLFGDFNQFIIVDRVGVSMLYDPLLKGTGASAQLPQGQAGWYMFWRTSSGISTTAAFRYLTIS